MLLLMTPQPLYASWFTIGLVLALSSTLLACGDARGPAPAKVCAKAYEQCVLSTGVIGVCNLVDCAANQSAPCLVCRSQH